MDKQKTVLIVEDEKNIVDILRFNLQREGYRTCEAYDGEDGLNKARTENPDLILLDVRTQEEYDDGHIPGAVCLPSDMIEEGMPFSFDKDAESLRYCHSDKRSAEAASRLRAMGYTNVSDIGCILDWPYETTTD